MNPETHFALVHADYGRLADLLAPCGVGLRQTSRDVKSMLGYEIDGWHDQDEVEVEIIHGKLLHADRRFAFTFERNNQEAWLTVHHPSDAESSGWPALRAVLERALSPPASQPVVPIKAPPVTLTWAHIIVMIVLSPFALVIGLCLLPFWAMGAGFGWTFKSTRNVGIALFVIFKLGSLAYFVTAAATHVLVTAR